MGHRERARRDAARPGLPVRATGRIERAARPDLGGRIVSDNKSRAPGNAEGPSKTSAPLASGAGVDGDLTRGRRQSPPKSTTANWSAEELELLAQHREGRTVVVNLSQARNAPHRHLVAWARDAGVVARVDRGTRYGNPYKLGRDGTRDEVIDAYHRHLAASPDLAAAVPALRGRVLGCWCAPQRCHGDLLAALADGREVDR